MTTYHIRAYRPTDLALIEEEQETKWMAYKLARHHYANGYNVIVRRVTRKTVAEWKQEERRDD